MSARILLGLGVAAGLLATPALADTYKFTLHNDSKYAITGFETKEDGKWTKWEGVKAGPGDTQEMEWTAANAECHVPFRVIYKDVETEEYSIDWCKITNIHVEDDKVYGN